MIGGTPQLQCNTGFRSERKKGPRAAANAEAQHATGRTQRRSAAHLIPLLVATPLSFIHPLLQQAFIPS